MIVAARARRAEHRDMAIRATVALKLMPGLAGCPQRTCFLGMTLKNQCDHSVRVTTTHAPDTTRCDSSMVIGPSQLDTRCRQAMEN
jgi:hypothetical protein